MDELPNNPDAHGAPVLDGGFESFSLNDLRVAVVSLDRSPADYNRPPVPVSNLNGESVEALLLDAGAVLCEATSEELDLVVFDSNRDDVESLRTGLAGSLIDRLQSGNVAIVSQQQLLDFLNKGDPRIHSLYTPAMLAELLDVPLSTIRSWHRRGLIQPVSKVSKLPYFDFQEVAAAKQLATLVDLGIRPATIEKNLVQLARWMPDIDRPLTQLTVLVEGNRILLRQGDGLVEPGGQKRINFTHDHLQADSQGVLSDSRGDSPATVFSLEHYRLENTADNSPTPATRGQFIEIAEQLEEAGELLEAIETWRSMQLAFGPTAEGCLRLGELLYRVGHVHAACERYYMAIELDDEMVEARAALGCVLSEQGQTELAISAFEGALEHHPDYADVHFHLARVLENAGNSVQALSHWKRFVALTPDSPWADEARNHIKVGD